MGVERSTKSRRKNWLVKLLRSWHKKLGIIAVLFLVIVGITGIVLNYKKPIFAMVGLEAPKNSESGSSLAIPGLSTSAGASLLPVGLDRALAIAQAEWGDVPLERIEIKTEHAVSLYKFKKMDGMELWVNAVSGEHILKKKYERPWQMTEEGVTVRQLDWGKILTDLHTGKIGGEWGKAMMSIIALLLVFLSISGMHIYIKTWLIRRSNA